jgi:hypothetical protein
MMEDRQCQTGEDREPTETRLGVLHPHTTDRAMSAPYGVLQQKRGWFLRSSPTR